MLSPATIRFLNTCATSVGIIVVDCKGCKWQAHWNCSILRWCCHLVALDFELSCLPWLSSSIALLCCCILMSMILRWHRRGSSCGQIRALFIGWRECAWLNFNSHFKTNFIIHVSGFFFAHYGLGLVSEPMFVKLGFIVWFEIMLDQNAWKIHFLFPD